MLINMKQKINEPEIKHLLGFSVFPDPDKLEKVVNEYKNDLQAMGEGCC